MKSNTFLIQLILLISILTQTNSQQSFQNDPLLSQSLTMKYRILQQVTNNENPFNIDSLSLDNEAIIPSIDEQQINDFLSDINRKENFNTDNLKTQQTNDLNNESMNIFDFNTDPSRTNQDNLKDEVPQKSDTNNNLNNLNNSDFNNTQIDVPQTDDSKLYDTQINDSKNDNSSIDNLDTKQLNTEVSTENQDTEEINLETQIIDISQNNNSTHDQSNLDELDNDIQIKNDLSSESYDKLDAVVPQTIDSNSNNITILISENETLNINDLNKETGNLNNSNTNNSQNDTIISDTPIEIQENQNAANLNIDESIKPDDSNIDNFYIQIPQNSDLSNDSSNQSSDPINSNADDLTNNSKTIENLDELIIDPSIEALNTNNSKQNLENDNSKTDDSNNDPLNLIDSDTDNSTNDIPITDDPQIDNSNNHNITNNSDTTNQNSDLLQQTDDSQINDPPIDNSKNDSSNIKEQDNSSNINDSIENQDLEDSNQDQIINITQNDDPINSSKDVFKNTDSSNENQISDISNDNINTEPPKDDNSSMNKDVIQELNTGSPQTNESIADAFNLSNTETPPIDDLNGNQSEENNKNSDQIEESINIDNNNTDSPIIDDFKNENLNIPPTEMNNTSNDDNITTSNTDNNPSLNADSNTEFQCEQSQYSYFNNSIIICVDECPSGMIVFQAEKQCLENIAACNAINKVITIKDSITYCVDSCNQDNNEYAKQFQEYKECTVCGQLLKIDTNTCVDTCVEGYVNVNFKQCVLKANKDEACKGQILYRDDDLKCSQHCFYPYFLKDNQCNSLCTTNGCNNCSTNEVLGQDGDNYTCMQRQDCNSYISSDMLTCVSNCNKINELVPSSTQQKVCIACSEQEIFIITYNEGKCQQKSSASLYQIKQTVTSQLVNITNEYEANIVKQSLSEFVTSVSYYINPQSNTSILLGEIESLILQYLTSTSTLSNAFQSQSIGSIDTIKTMFQRIDQGKIVKESFNISSLLNNDLPQLLQDVGDFTSSNFTGYVISSIIINNPGCNSKQCLDFPLFKFNPSSDTQRMLSHQQNYQAIFTVSEKSDLYVCLTYDLTSNNVKSHSIPTVSSDGLSLTCQITDDNVSILKDSSYVYIKKEMSTAQKSDQKNLSTGGIIGIVVGSVVFLIILTISFYYLFKKIAKGKKDSEYHIQDAESQKIGRN